MMKQIFYVCSVIILLVACSQPTPQAESSDEAITIDLGEVMSPEGEVASSDTSEVISPEDEVPPSNSMSSSNNSMGGNNMMGSNSMSVNDPPPQLFTPDENLWGEALSNEEMQAAQIILDNPDVARALAAQPEWGISIWSEEEGFFEVEFLRWEGEEEEWLGWGAVDLEANRVVELFVPEVISEEEREIIKGQILAYLQADAEVQALVGDLSQWEYDIEYDPFEDGWTAYLWKGLDEFAISFYMKDDTLELGEIVDLNLLEAEEVQEMQRHLAIELAYEADGVDQALEGYDNWRSYAEEQGNGRWSVSFVADEQELFFALVDIENWQILETR